MVQAPAAPPLPDGPALPLAWRRRLREVWRSAGWPCRDTVELELLAAGLLERLLDGHGHETLRLTDAGVRALAGSVASHRRAHGAHEALVSRVALMMQRDGRLVWRGLSLRADGLAGLACLAEEDAPADVTTDVDLADLFDAAPGVLTAGDTPHEGVVPSVARPARRWVTAVPDVYSIRRTTREAWVEPVVHEIKVSRADLLSDLRQPRKGAAYLALSSQCWYVLMEGIGLPEEIPPAFGVMVARAGADAGDRACIAAESFDGELQVLRPAPRRPHRIAFATWMALARAAPEPSSAGDSPAQDLF